MNPLSSALLRSTSAWSIWMRTAMAHVAAILVKLQAGDRTEAVTRGFERGLLKP